MSQFKSEKIKIGQIDVIITRYLSHLMETTEGTIGDHPKWLFLRQALLRRINELRHELLDEIMMIATESAQKGAKHGHK